MNTEATVLLVLVIACFLMIVVGVLGSLFLVSRLKRRWDAIDREIADRRREIRQGGKSVRRPQ
jgi:hypothetical protein